MAFSFQICMVSILVLLSMNLSAAFTPAFISVNSRTVRSSFALSAGSTTIERDAVVKGDSPAILVRPVIEKQQKKLEDPVKESRGCSSESWEVRIYNDGLNTREHVARCLVQVTGLSEFMAYKTMMHAHNHGMAVVGRYAYEIAELYQDQLKTRGLVCDIIPVGDMM